MEKTFLKERTVAILLTMTEAQLTDAQRLAREWKPKRK